MAECHNCGGNGMCQDPFHCSINWIGDLVSAGTCDTCGGASSDPLNCSVCGGTGQVEEDDED